MSQTLI